MTAVMTDRIEMAESSEPSLDDLFGVLEQMHVPEGFKAEIVEGTIYVAPQRDNHWDITFDLMRQLFPRFPKKQLKSDVMIDFPGYQNGFAADVIGLRDGAQRDEKKRWRYQDIEFVAEVISRGTARNDYGPKKSAYAMAEVPVYLIVDPYRGQCHLHLRPKGDEFRSEEVLDFGEPIDLSGTAVGLVLDTSEFERE